MKYACSIGRLVTAIAVAANPTFTTRTARLSSASHAATSPSSAHVKNLSALAGCQHVARHVAACPPATSDAPSRSGASATRNTSQFAVPATITSDPGTQSRARTGLGLVAIPDPLGCARTSGSVTGSPTSPPDASNRATTPSAPPVSNVSSSSLRRNAATPPPHATAPSGWIVRGPRLCALIRRTARPSRHTSNVPLGMPVTIAPSPPGSDAGGFKNSQLPTSSTPNAPKRIVSLDHAPPRGSPVVAARRQSFTCFFPHVQNRSTVREWRSQRTPNTP